MTTIWPGGPPSENDRGHKADANEDQQEKFPTPDVDRADRSRAMTARERLLARIASSLNKAETEFLQDAPAAGNAGADAEEPHVLVAECAELVRLYCSFPDPESRRQWLGLLRAAVSREPG